MKIVGYSRKIYDFDDSRGQHVHTEGYEIHLSEPFPSSSSDSKGYRTERIFLSDAKLNGAKLVLNAECEIYYNKYGKIATLHFR